MAPKEKRGEVDENVLQHLLKSEKIWDRSLGVSEGQARIIFDKYKKNIAVSLSGIMCMWR